MRSSLPCDIREFRLLRFCPGEVLEEGLDIVYEIVPDWNPSKARER